MKKTFLRLWVALALSAFAFQTGAAAQASTHFEEIVSLDSEDSDIGRLEAAQSTKSGLTREQKKELRKKRRKRLARNVGRFLGRMSTTTYVGISQAFLASGGFIRGFSEKPEKNKRVVAILRFIIHSPHFASLRASYQKAGTFEEYLVQFGIDLADLLQKETETMVMEILREVDPSIPADQELLKLDFTKVNLTKLDAAKVRANARFQLIDEAFGPFPVDAMVKDFKAAALDPSFLEESVDAEEVGISIVTHLPEWKELGAVFLGEHLVTPWILGAISQTAGALYTWPVLATAGGTVASVITCTRAKTKARIDLAGKGVAAYTDPEQYENDADLRNFCSYVTNQSIFRLALSREKGYLSGKKLGAKVRLKLRKLLKKNPPTTPPAPVVSVIAD